MKVVVIYGQSHKGNTYRLTEMLISRLKCSEEDIKEFRINGISQCVGCYKCIMEDEKKCPHRSETEPVINAIEEADVIVMASPNYCFEMTGQLKSFCDHMAYRWVVHRPVDMRGKIGVAVSTTAGGGAGSVTKSLKRHMQWWSVGRVYRINFAVNAVKWEEIKSSRLERIDRKAASVANKINGRLQNGENPSLSKPCLKVRVLFWIMKKMHSGHNWNELERVYWQKELLK